LRHIASPCNRRDVLWVRPKLRTRWSSALPFCGRDTGACALSLGRCGILLIGACPLHVLEGSEDRIFQGLEGFLLLSRTIGLIRCGVCKLRLYLQRPVECCRLPRDRSAWPASRHKHHYQRTLDNKGLQRQQDGEICLGLGNGWSWTNIIRVTRTPSPLLCETMVDD